jgi:hypothetical protein
LPPVNAYGLPLMGVGLTPGTAVPVNDSQLMQAQMRALADREASAGGTQAQETAASKSNVSVDSNNDTDFRRDRVRICVFSLYLCGCSVVVDSADGPTIRIMVTTSAVVAGCNAGAASGAVGLVVIEEVVVSADGVAITVATTGVATDLDVSIEVALAVGQSIDHC